MKNLSTYAALFLLGIVALLSGCNRENIKGEKDFQSSMDHAFVENESQKLVELFDHEADENGVNKVTASYLPDCATVTVEVTTGTSFITIDFGETNCLCSNWDGKLRRGSVTVTWTGLYHEAGSQHTITTDNYHVNDDEFIFSKTVTNAGENGAGNLEFTVEVEATVNLAAGGSITWNSNRKREWVEGSTTLLNPFDDVYHITGTAAGTNREGRKFNVTVNEALEVLVGCRWIRSGILTISPEGLQDRVVDYGDGTCDNKATVTVGDYSIEITMN